MPTTIDPAKVQAVASKLLSAGSLMPGPREYVVLCVPAPDRDQGLRVGDVVVMSAIKLPPITRAFVRARDLTVHDIAAGHSYLIVGAVEDFR